MNLNDLRTMLKEWNLWLSLIILIIPGLLFQLNVKGIHLHEYTGLSFIGLLILSFYYSLPYIFLSFLYIKIVLKKAGNSSFDKFDLLLMSLYTILFYWFTTFFIPMLFPGKEILSYYFILMVMLIGVGVVHHKVEGFYKKIIEKIKKSKN